MNTNPVPELRLLASLAIVLVATAHAQLIKQSLSGSDASLFSFTTPSAGGPKVIVAKFVTEDPPGPFDIGNPLDNLRFELLPPPSSAVDSTSFVLSDTVKSIDNKAGTDTVCDVRAVVTADPAAPNFRIIKIRVFFRYSYVFPGPESWQLLAKNPGVAGTIHFVGFESDNLGPDLATMEAVAEAAATKPYLINYIQDGSGNPDVWNFPLFVDFASDQVLTFGSAHVNSSDAFAWKESYDFINIGTAPLSITGVNPAAAPAGPYSASPYFTAPSTILPAAALTGVVFKFLPTTTGPATDVNITLTVNSPPISQLKVNLTGGKGVRLRTGLLVDISGSMLDDVHGVSTSLESASKMYKARDAARYFVDVYRLNIPEAEIGLVTYPNLAGACPAAEQVVNYDKVQNPGLFSALHDKRLDRNDSGRIKPVDEFFQTPMVAGLDLVRASLPPVSPVEYNKRLVFMVGDGQHNCPSGTSPFSSKSALETSGIKFYTIPYGDDHAAWTQQLKDIATWTGGGSFPVNLDNEEGPGGLKKRSENALREVIGLETITDPSGTIQRSQKVRNVVCIPEEEYVLNFLVHWQNERVGAISVALEAPDGTRIDKTTAASQPADVGYFETDSSAGFCVRGSFLAARKGVGEWWIELTGTTAIPQGQSVDFSYSVYSQSSLKSGYRINPWLTGMTSAVALFVGEAAHSVRAGGSAMLQYRAPTVWFGNWLATAKVDPQLILSVTNTVDGLPLSLAERKMWVLRNRMEQTFDPQWVTNVLEVQPAQEARGQAVYAANLDTARVPGSYEFVGKLAGRTMHGDCFEREISFIHRVRINYRPDLLQQALRIFTPEITPFYPATLAEAIRKGPPDGEKFTAVEFTPRDELGNLAGPGSGDQIAIALADGKLLEGVVDNLDGSFTYIAQHKAGSDPAVTVGLEGVSTAPIRFSVIDGTAPVIRVTRSASDITLRWFGDGVALEETGALPLGWKPSTTQVTTQGNTNTAVVRPSDSSRFYRLRR